MNAQGVEMGVLGTTTISYPRTVQILSGCEDLQRESLIELVAKSGMGDHLTMPQLLKFTNDPEGREVRRFVEGFLAEFVALEDTFSEHLRVMKRPVCSGKTVLSMLTGMVDHLKAVTMGNPSRGNTLQQQSKTQVRPQLKSTPAPRGKNTVVAEVEQQSVGNNAQGVNQHQQQQPQGLRAGMGTTGGALPYQAQQGSMGDGVQ